MTEPQPQRPTTEQSTPPKWKFAVIVVLGLYPILILVIWLMGQIFGTAYLGVAVPHWPSFLVRTLVTVLIVVPIMVWGALPLLSRLLGPWLRS